MVHVLDFFNGLFYAFSDFRERHRPRKYYQSRKGTAFTRVRGDSDN